VKHDQCLNHPKACLIGLSHNDMYLVPSSAPGIHYEAWNLIGGGGGRNKSCKLYVLCRQIWKYGKLWKYCSIMEQLRTVGDIGISRQKHLHGTRENIE
jgi:hypothetical protein